MTRVRRIPQANEPCSYPERLQKNLNGYSGETVPIDAVLQKTLEAATRNSWEVEHIPAPPISTLVGLRRIAPHAKQRNKRIYISAGIHGDEPAGPLAALRLILESSWPEGIDLWVCPCLNPTGFAINRRENCQGTDLNRQYRQPKAVEVIAHIRWLQQQPSFDLGLLLHEDWEAHGFYLYELNPDSQPSLAEGIIASVEAVCPIDRSETIEGRAASNGIIRPEPNLITRPDWPEAFFLLDRKTRLNYTLEAPSDFPLATRVEALVEAVRAAVTAV